MSEGKMSAKDRRAVVVGVSVIVAALLLVRGIPAYRGALTDTRDRLASERDALARERAAVTAASRNPQLQHLADSAMRAATPRLFEGRDDVMASAELVTYLSGLTRQNRVLLQDAQTRPATASPSGVRTLHVDIRAESDLRGILALLQALERGGKLVRIDRIDISRNPRGMSDPGMEVLSLAASLSAFALPGDAAPAGDVHPASTASAAQVGATP
jgi:hypothetical protein